MITQKEFEHLDFNECCAEPFPWGSLEEPLYDWEYQGGLYENLEAPGVQFGYGEKTGTQLVYTLCEDCEDNALSVSNANRTLQKIGFPYLIGDKFPDGLKLEEKFSSVKVRKNPHTRGMEARAYSDFLHVWIGASPRGTIDMVHLHSVELVRQNLLETEELTSDFLHSLA